VGKQICKKRKGGFLGGEKTLLKNVLWLRLTAFFKRVFFTGGLFLSLSVEKFFKLYG
jgi:hypothetical protein